MYIIAVSNDDSEQITKRRKVLCVCLHNQPATLHLKDVKHQNNLKDSNNQNDFKNYRLLNYYSKDVLPKTR